MPPSGLASLLALLVSISVLSVATLQTIPNGADHYYMTDVGETQVVLNVWGTLHATGYPLYVISGSALVALLKGVGVDAAAAPALVSLLWGLAALSLFYALLHHLTGRAVIAAGAALLLALTRTVWMHNVIAEIYSFGLLLLVALLAVGLWRAPLVGRVYWLAFIGGVAVAHHRALVMAAPALLLAAWGDLTHPPRRLPLRLLAALLLGSLGLLQYVYLPLRAWAGADWVYGEPGTWAGLLDQFWGVEAARFIGLPDTFEGLLANFSLINTVLITDLTLPGLVVGIVGLAAALRTEPLRRAALTFSLSGGVAYLFHVVYYTDVLSALILAILVSIAAGWGLLAALLLDRFDGWRARAGLVAAACLLGVYLLAQNFPFIRQLTTDPTGLDTIALVEQTPPGAALMIDWGPRHFAAGFADAVLDTLPAVTLVDHKADFAALLASGERLVTPSYTFYNRPVSWWRDQLGTDVYLTAAAPGLVEIATTPQRSPAAVEALTGTGSLDCADGSLLLTVEWRAPVQPAQDLSVFVHLLDAEGSLLAQADQSAPVYGWRPLTTWTAGEVIRDMYNLPRHAAAAQIRFGLYHQGAGGTFENVLDEGLPVVCDAD